MTEYTLKKLSILISNLCTLSYFLQTTSRRLQQNKKLLTVWFNMVSFTQTTRYLKNHINILFM